MSFGVSRDIFADNRQTIDRCALLGIGLAPRLALDVSDVYSLTPMAGGCSQGDRVALALSEAQAIIAVSAPVCESASSPL
jgi:hypothetical protein